MILEPWVNRTKADPPETAADEAEFALWSPQT
jgi:hypothetical protein